MDNNNVIILMIKKLEQESDIEKMSTYDFDFIKTLKDIKLSSLSGRQKIRIYNLYDKYCEGNE